MHDHGLVQQVAVGEHGGVDGVTGVSGHGGVPSRDVEGRGVVAASGVSTRSVAAG